MQLYKAAKKRFDVDDDFKVRSREGVVKLQAGDEEAYAAWESLCAASRVEYQKVSLVAVRCIVLMFRVFVFCRLISFIASIFSMFVKNRVALDLRLAQHSRIGGAW